MKLTAYQLCDPPLEIVPCSPNREWMEFFERFPYKCLPLTMANATGWDVLFNDDVTLTWRGEDRVDSLTIDNRTPLNAWCTSHFGNGIMTMNLPYLFQTSPGVDLWVRGPSNQPRHGIVALEGVVESWWVPFTFTMNWKLTQPGSVTFKKGDVACRIVPFPHAYVEQFETSIERLADHPELYRRYRHWHESRNEFNSRGKREGWAGLDWQKHYHRGEDFATGEKIEGHKTTIKAAEFRRKGADGEESLGWQLAQLLGQGLDDAAVLQTLEGDEARQKRGGLPVTPERLIAAYRELWQVDENTRYVLRFTGTQEYYKTEYDTYEEAKEAAAKLPPVLIVRVQI